LAAVRPRRQPPLTGRQNERPVDTCTVSL
jgi:hypothetical protein